MIQLLDYNCFVKRYDPTIHTNNNRGIIHTKYGDMVIIDRSGKTVVMLKKILDGYKQIPSEILASYIEFLIDNGATVD